jgi:uncharacterized Zn finger protein (UPF0148 family)
MSNTIEVIETYSTIHCGECGVPFALNDEFIRERRKDHKTWYCPNGHARAYLGKNETELAKAEAERFRRQLESREADLRFEQRRLANERKSHAATKGQLTKTRKRAEHAMCPVDGCHRHFANVERHIARVHPEFTPA